MANERIWNIRCSGTISNGDKFQDVEFEMLAFAEDAGAAWMRFQKDLEGVKWYEISVTEVKRNERSQGISGTHQMV